MMPLTIALTDGTALTLGGAPTVCPGLVVTPELSVETVTRDLTYTGAWTLTHAASGRTLTAGLYLFEAHAAAETADGLDLDWTHPDPRQWPATDRDRVKAALTDYRPTTSAGAR